MPQPLAEALAISKSFDGVRALKNVTFELRAGEVHALIGENGAGKSTLIRILAGATTQDSGTLRIGGNTLTTNDPGTAKALGIAVIYQQPQLFPHLTVAENIDLALESGSAFRRIDWHARNLRAKELLARAGSAIDPARLAASLSMPEQQIVEIAKAIGTNARVVIMDEPTASLSDLETQSLFRVIEKLRTEGAGILYVSHRLEEITAIADRITVLRDGESIATRPAAGVTRNELIAMMVGREVATPATRTTNRGALALEFQNLKVHCGEILGIAGLVGSGRTELAETIFGMRPGGEFTSPADAIRNGIAYVPEDRRSHGIVPELSIATNINLAKSKTGLIDHATENQRAEGFTNRLRIKTQTIHEPTAALSGGNQQKVALARWLACDPKILILDEPTQGVDIGAKTEIHALIQSLAAEGKAIILISSELPELLALSDRIAVMRNGTIATEFSRAEATQENILAAALGHSC